MRADLPNLYLLTDLEHLNLQHNNFTGPLFDLTLLTNLESVRINHNHLGGFFPDWSHLQHLTTLYAKGNVFWCPVRSYEWVQDHDFTPEHCWSLPTIDPSL